MFDVGFSEMFMILVIALIVIGPERLPAVAKKVGKFIGKAKRSFENIKREVQSELETEELNKRLAENNILQDTKDVVSEISDELKNIAKKGNEKIPETKDLNS
ncbi:Twin-arginine translocation protein TatB [hydrothermal vent metagenome]|uniref:Twin-arginine translocation protein TatB n=1 Tax=hydrothermal vent metagenome TaxID=652676 RepID=A0A3B0VP38_9ZZZZ